MSYRGLNSFITDLEKRNELRRIKSYANPVLEITEIADRMVKARGPALLFENNGTEFPLLINAFGSEERMAMALNSRSIEEASSEIEAAFKQLQSPASGIIEKIKALPAILRLSRIMPSRRSRKGRCQKTVIKNPDLSFLPVLKCWPHDGGRFVTLPIVHTYHPDSHRTNAGMYRMQIIDKNTAAMHWQMHKTGANHFEAWKKTGMRMPVSVVLGGDPVYTYAATAPLPENIDEYILAGFLRKKSVRLVRCLTNNIYVPEDADIVIEGYVDPAEELFWEGPFGDHTGFYSLADWYPKFHVTCITHALDAVYPATIVGIPPQEDEILALATEKLFLPPIRLALSPEIEDLHMPAAGVAHNLAVVKIRKNYPGQGLKVINSLLGAGQMMFTKFLIVVSGDIDIRNYKALAMEVAGNVSTGHDLIFMRGPLDVLDHSSDTYAFGGKLGIDATVKTEEESGGRDTIKKEIDINVAFFEKLKEDGMISDFTIPFNDLPSIILSVSSGAGSSERCRLSDLLGQDGNVGNLSYLILVDHRIDLSDIFTIAWQVLGNTDPVRDHLYIDGSAILLDGTIKAYRKDGFPRRWPDIVCSSESTISLVDEKWDSYGLGKALPSPSAKHKRLISSNSEEVKE